jgi:hypothetical protein
MEKIQIEEELITVKNFRASWENTDLTATVPADSAEEVYGMCGLFYFDQGGKGNMPCPVYVEEVGKGA